MPQWNQIDKDEKRTLIQEIIDNKNIPLKIDRIEIFSQNDTTIETVVMLHENSEFVFVPGMEDVVLGWDENCELNYKVVQDLKEDKLQEIEYYKTEYEEIVDLDKYIEEFKNIIINSSSPVRNVHINPMIVERDLNDVSEYNSYNEFVESLKNTIFSLPSEDEYEYLLAGGKRTLFRWGDSLKRELDLIYKIGTISDEENVLYEPNMFGLHILFDSYMYELVDDKCFYKGADGGCSLCGGEGAIGVVPVFSNFYRPYISEDIGWETNKEYCYYRRIIHIA